MNSITGVYMQNKTHERERLIKNNRVKQTSHLLHRRFRCAYAWIFLL